MAEKLQVAPQAKPVALVEDEMNKRAQIELNQIIQRKLSEFRSISASRPTQNKRETEMAIKIDNLTMQLREFEIVQSENKTLVNQNSLAKQQLELMKRQL